MAIISALFGILLFYLGGIPRAFVVCAVLLGAGVAALALGFAVGAQAPGLASFSLRASLLGSLALGAAMACLGIVVVAEILAWGGPSPAPRTEAVSAALIALTAAVAEKYTNLSARLMPSNLARIAIARRYGERFPERREGESRRYAAAYRAIVVDPTSDDGGQINGWGYSSTIRRLRLIRQGLEEQS